LTYSCTYLTAFVNAIVLPNCKNIAMNAGMKFLARKRLND